MSKEKYTREDAFTPRGDRFFTLPEEKVSFATLDREYDIAKTRFPVVYGDEQWAKPGTLPDVVGLEFAFDMVKTRNPNLVEPTMFLGAWEIEREAISMLAELFYHPNYSKKDYTPAGNPVLGWFTDGGTNSLLQAGWSFRNKYFRDLEQEINKGLNKEPEESDMKKHRGIIREEGIFGLVSNGLVNPKTPPVVLAPVDMHFAGDKVADVLGIGSRNIVRYGLDQNFETDYEDLTKILKELSEAGRRVIFAIANAGSVHTGRVEDVQKFYEILRNADCKAPIIVDAAQQYMMLAMLKDNYPAWDFRVEGVEAIVADPHKTDAAPYPASVVIYRNKEIAYDTQNTAGYLHIKDDLDYDMKKLWNLMPPIPTSRSPIGAISTWAHLLRNGRRRLTEKYQNMLSLTTDLAEYIKEMGHYKLICEPKTGIIAFHVKDFDDLKAEEVYHEFQVCNERPRFYITYDDSIRITTPQAMAFYCQKKIETPDDKVRGFGGLYIQVMQHATKDLVEKLADRLDLIGYEVTRGKKWRQEREKCLTC